MFSRSGKFGYLNERGERVVEARFAGCWRFSEGLAEVRESPEGKSGYINKNGEYVIPPRFDKASPFKAGLAFVKERESSGFINPLGEWVIRDGDRFSRFDYRGFSQGLAGGYDGEGLGGFINTSGEWAIPPEYPFIGVFSDGFAAARNKEGAWGYIDIGGKAAIAFQFEEAYSFNCGIAHAVTADGVKCYIRKNGEPAFRDEGNTYVWMGDFSEGLGRIVRKGALPGYKYGEGFMNDSGREAIKPEFFNCDSFSDGLAQVCFKPRSRWGYINKDGKIVIGMVYHVALPFSGGIAPAGIKGKGMGCINREGNEVINFIYGFVGGFNEGMAIYCR